MTAASALHLACLLFATPAWAAPGPLLWPATLVPLLAGSPATVSVIISPNSLNADYTQAATVEVHVTDASSTAVAGQKVSLAVSGFGNSIATTTGTTDGTGTYTLRLKSFGAQQKVVTATAGTAKGYATATFTPGPPDASATVLSITPRNGLAADGRSPCLISAIVVDAYRNRIANQPVVLTSTGTNNAIDQNSGVTSSLGTFFATLITTTAETKTVTLTAGSASTQATVSFVGGEPNVSMTSLAVSPNAGAVAGDGNDAFTVTTSVKDVFGNAVASYPVALSSGGIAARFDTAEGVTGPRGDFATKFRASETGNAIIYASAGSFSATATVQFVVGAPTSQMSSIDITPATIVADNNQSVRISVTARDAAGNQAPNRTVTLTVAGTNNNLGASSGLTDGNGVFVTSLSSSTAESKIVNFKTGTAHNRGYATFVAGPPDSNNSSFEANPNLSVAADRSGTFLLKATIRDSFGNPVRGAPVTFVSTGMNDVFSATSLNTSPFGIATALLRSTSVGTPTITIAAGGLSMNTNVSFVLGALSTASSSFSASPLTNLVADGNSTTTLSADLRDYVGHPLANQNVTFVSSNLLDTLGTSSGTYGAVSDANGHVSVAMSTTRAEKKNVLLDVNGGRMAVALTFVPGPPTAADARLTLFPPSVPADGRTSEQVTVDVADAYGNGCYGQTITIAAGGGNNMVGQSTGTTGTSGSFSTTLRSTMAEIKHITATVQNITLEGNATFVAGLAQTADSTFVVSPNSNLTADNVAAANVIVTALDAYNNPLRGTKVYFTSNLAGSTFTPRTGVLDANGSITSTMVSKSAGSTKVMLQVGPITLNANVQFVAGSPNAAASTFVATPPAGLAANAVAYSVLTGIVRDRFNNAVSNVAVTVSSSDGNDLLANANGITDARGLFSTRLRSTKTGSKNIVFAGGGVSLAANVVFMPGAPNATLSSFTTDTTNLPADNVAVANLRVRMADNYNNLIPGLYVSFSSNSSRNSFVPVGGSTDGNGVFRSTWRSAGAGSKVATATAGTFVLALPSVTFTPGSPNATSSRLQASPAGGVLANGNANSVITVTVLDIFSNPLAGQSVTFTSSGPADAFASASGTTDASGIYASALTSTQSGAKTVTATFGALSKSMTVNFIAPTSSWWQPGEQRYASAFVGRDTPGAALAWPPGPAAEQQPSFAAATLTTQAAYFGEGHSAAPAERARLWPITVSCDIDHDGLPDAITANVGQSGVWLVRGASLYVGSEGQQVGTCPGGEACGLIGASVGGEFVPLGVLPTSLACADLGQEALAELVVASADVPQVTVYSFASPLGQLVSETGRAYALPGRPHRLAVADVDQDGTSDVAVAGESGTGVLFGDSATGTLTAYRATGDVAARSVSLCDVDGDGLLDLAFRPLTGGPDAFYRGLGGQAFGATAAAVEPRWQPVGRPNSKVQPDAQPD